MICGNTDTTSWHGPDDPNALQGYPTGFQSRLGIFDMETYMDDPQAGQRTELDCRAHETTRLKDLAGAEYACRSDPGLDRFP
jgi:hypothetical protein